MIGRRLVWFLAAVLAAATAGVAIARVVAGDATSAFPSIATVHGIGPFDHDFVIPAGTGDRIDGGEPVEILPAELVVRVGETLRIVNHDDRSHLVGPFYLRAGETLTQAFRSPGVLAGDCTAHPSRRFVLTVLR